MCVYDHVHIIKKFITTVWNESRSWLIEYGTFRSVFVCIISDFFQGEIYSPSFILFSFFPYLLWSISIHELYSTRHDIAHRTSIFFFLLYNRTFAILNYMYRVNVENTTPPFPLRHPIYIPELY